MKYCGILEATESLPCNESTNVNAPIPLDDDVIPELQDLVRLKPQKIPSDENKDAKGDLNVIL